MPLECTNVLWFDLDREHRRRFWQRFSRGRSQCPQFGVNDEHEHFASPRPFTDEQSQQCLFLGCALRGIEAGDGRHHAALFVTRLIERHYSQGFSVPGLIEIAKQGLEKMRDTTASMFSCPLDRWAFAEATVLFLRHNQPGKEYFAKLEHQHGKAKALAVLAHKLCREVADCGRRIVRSSPTLDYWPQARIGPSPRPRVTSS